MVTFKTTSSVKILKPLAKTCVGQRNSAKTPVLHYALPDAKFCQPSPEIVAVFKLYTQH